MEKLKRNKRKILKVAATIGIAAVLVTTGFFVGKSGESTTPVVEEPVEATVETVSEATTPPGQPVWDPPDLRGRTFVIWGLEYDPHIEAYERLAKKFEEYTGAKATIEPQGWPLEDKIITGMAADMVPDVCCIMGKQIAPLIDQGALVALDELVYDAVSCDKDTWFGPVGLQAYQYDGKTWGVPTEGNCVSGVANVPLDLIEEYGVEDMWPPLNGEDGFESFEDMWALAKALQETDEDGNVTRWGLSTEGWDNRHLFGIMRTLGQDWWDPETRTLHLDSPEALEAMNLLAYRPIFELGIETHQEMGGQELMNAGKAAIACGNVTGPSTGRELGIRIDTALYPSAVPGKDALYVGEGGWGFVVPAQAENKDVGIEFMKFLTTYEGNKTYCEIYGGIVSAVLAVNYDDELFPVGDLVGDAMRRAGKAQERTVYYGTGYGTPSEMEGIVSAAVEAVRIGKSTPEEALDEAQALLEEMLERWDAEH